jgi:hypothetical protein
MSARQCQSIGKPFGLTFGAMAPLIRRQLAEDDAHDIVCLKIHGLLTDSQAEMARKKLLKRLVKVVRRG